MEQIRKHEASILLSTPSCSSAQISHTRSLSTRKHYKPWMLRAPALLFLLATILALIGLVEYAFHVLPNAGSNGLIGSVKEKLDDYFYDRRDVVDQNYISTITTTIGGTKQTLAVTYGPDCAPGSTCAPPPEFWLPLGTVTLFKETTDPTPIPTAPPTTVGGPAPSYWLPAGVVTLSSGTTELSTTTITSPSTTITQITTQTSKPVVYVFLVGDYFLGAFLPTILAVLFALPWLIIDAKVRKLEPFHQLANNNGALAGKSICADYSSQFTTPCKALFSGHLAPVLTFILSIAALLITPLAPETVSIRMEGSCNATTTGCIPSLSIYPVAGRLIQAILCIMALVTIVLLLHMFRYPTGVFAEPFSIAGLATLFHNQDVIDDLRQAGGTSKKHIKKYFAKRRYRLDFYTDQDGWEKYGIVPQHVPTQPEFILQKVGGAVHTRGVGHLFLEEDIKLKHPHLAGAVGLIFSLLGLLAIIVYYKLTYTDSGFERFMDSQGFGVKFLFTAIGVLIKLYWSSIFKDVAQLEAYRNLARRNAQAKDSILISAHSIPLLAIPSSIMSGHIFTALIAFVAFLADVLTVTLSNIQFKTETTWTAYTVCTWMSCSIIALMLITLIALAFHRQPTLPVEPSTIAGVLSLLCWSSIPGRFSDLTMISAKERNSRIGELGLRYGIGGVRDENGQVMVGIEVERSPPHNGFGRRVAANVQYSI